MWLFEWQKFCDKRFFESNEETAKPIRITWFVELQKSELLELYIKLSKVVFLSWKIFGEVQIWWVNAFHATGLFSIPLETSGFLMLSGGIERDQWHEMR